jgi:hypothetical protein
MIKYLRLMSSSNKPASTGSLCGTRATKNAKHVYRIAPHLISRESGKGITSIIPAETLATLHKIAKPQEVIRNKELAELLDKNRPALASIDISGPLFKGTLHFVKLTFNTPNGSFTVSDADVQTIIDYSEHAVVPISKYASQYGSNSVEVSRDVLGYTEQMDRNEFTNTDMSEWVSDIAKENNFPTDGSVCVVILTDGRDRSPRNTDHVEGMLGYHDATEQDNIPYCYCRVLSPGVTLDDKEGSYAHIVSHEIAEMVVDPFLHEKNPEVCDACAGNCNNDWFCFFDNNNNYLGAEKDRSFGGYTFYINSICLPEFYNPDDDHGCAKSRPDNDERACAYPPPAT